MQIHRQALVRFTPEQMFDLVNDVEAYPRRFGWCLGAQVSERDDKHLVARLDLRFAGVTQHFSTRNTLDRPHGIRMQFVDGPFDWLHGVWSFTPLGERPSSDARVEAAAGSSRQSGSIPGQALPPRSGGGTARTVAENTTAGCKVALDLDFEVSNKLTGLAFGIGFRKLADRMVDDFCAEARRAYA